MPSAKFSSDGIRGIAGEWPIDSSGMWQIGLAIREYLLNPLRNVNKKKAKVYLGRDTRSSGRELSNALVAGLSCNEIEVVNLGVITTPGVAYLTRKHKADLGVIITASHNPPQYNGVKLLDSAGFRLKAEDETEIENLIANMDVGQRQRQIVTQTSTPENMYDLIKEYAADQVRLSGLRGRPIPRLLIDCANGAPARVFPEVFQSFGSTTQLVNIEQDGTQIGGDSGSEYVRHKPDRFAQLIGDTDSDYGLAFDGDGDRLLIMDRSGQVYDGIDILFVLVKYFHLNPKAKKALLVDEERSTDDIVTSDSTNRGLDLSLLKYGIATIRPEKHGDRNLEYVMKKKNLLFGAESVGNIIVNDARHGSADSLFASLLLIGIIAETAQENALSYLVSDYIKFPQSLVSDRPRQTPCLETLPGLEEMKQRYLALIGDDSRQKIWYSSTEPGRLTVMFEGSISSDPDVVNEAAQKVYSFIESSARPG